MKLFRFICAGIGSVILLLCTLLLMPFILLGSIIGLLFVAFCLVIYEKWKNFE